MTSSLDQQPNTYPAGLLRRLAAVVYDALLILALLMVFGFFGVAVTKGEANAHWLFKLLVWLVPVAFYTYFWRKGGQTLGMQAWRLRVQTVQGQRISRRQAGLRLVGGLAAWLCLGLGFVWLLFDAHKRAWPDLLSGTQVVVVPKNNK